MNEPEPRKHGGVSYRHPADIDGEPEEVARASLAALADITAVAYEVANSAHAQVRNAHMESLEELSPEAVLAWETGAEGRTLEGISSATERIRRVAAGLARRALESHSTVTELET